MREWLNNQFLAEAFTSEERKKIAEVENKNYSLKYVDRQVTFIDNGFTKDKIFCLSLDFIKECFYNNNRRDSRLATKSTDYASHVYKEATQDREVYDYFWFRTPCYKGIAGCNNGGDLLDEYPLYMNNLRGVRPAICINN